MLAELFGSQDATGLDTEFTLLWIGQDDTNEVMPHINMMQGNCGAPSGKKELWESASHAPATV
ncbi:hypothetical protein D3871_13305 [Noviherbaspirillum saxi]|uniref:Uncharacterized protein n=1 Tax=Noviherbaspirillum saxi TaxID=2320863 RepID=A0A3A3FUY1_9BURK|nr:hypothetical protein D3871_13305 [Noviherbaspirillum saxi]